MSINSSTSLAIFWWRPAAWLRVTGSDAASFLQGQFTNDLRALGQREEVYGLWLSVKGKVLADSFVMRGAGADEFWIGSYFSEVVVIRERLESHVIADEVTIEDATAAWEAVSVLDTADDPRDARTPRGEEFLFRGRRGRGPNVEWIFPRRASGAVRAHLAGRRELPADEIGRMRIAAGIPAVPIDAGPTDLPNEAGLDADALSYTKGCYLGQEVMARLKAMGQVRRRLLRVRGAGASPGALPAPVFVGARQVGELRSAVSDGATGWIGLAMVSLMHVAAGTELAFGPEASPAIQLLDSP